MRRVESVLLTYTNEYRFEYQFYAEFLRFIGVYVCENFMDDDGNVDINPRRYNVWPEINVNKYGRFQNDQRDKLEEVLADIFEESIPSLWIQDLLDIYVKNNLMQSSVTLQYYRTTRDEALVLAKGKAFENAAADLLDLIQNNESYLKEPNVRYAKLYCKQKANLAQYRYDGSYIYYMDKLAIEGTDILKEYPEFSNVWILLGLIYENSEKHIRDAIDSFLRGIEFIKDQPYAASVYYWLGRVCEGISSLQDFSDESYGRAYNTVPRYRNVYKFANVFYADGDLEKAIEYYEKCLERLETKKSYLDPLEQEYYFKVCVQMSSVYMKLEKYKQAMIKAVDAIRLKEEIEKEEMKNEYTKFYYDMYGDIEAKDYIRLTLKKMNPRNAYHNLAKACQKNGLEKEAETYWKLYGNS